MHLERAAGNVKVELHCFINVSEGGTARAARTRTRAALALRLCGCGASAGTIGVSGASARYPLFQLVTTSS